MVTIIDIRWDPNGLTNPLPVGPWFGDFALIAGTGATSGEWEWNKTNATLLLWVPHPNVAPSPRRLIAGLDQFTLPAVNGTTGTGTLQPGLVPAIQPPPFDWEVRAM
jgi:hypothetical protein